MKVKILLLSILTFSVKISLAQTLLYSVENNYTSIGREFSSGKDGTSQKESFSQRRKGDDYFIPVIENLIKGFTDKNNCYLFTRVISLDVINQYQNDKNAILQAYLTNGLKKKVGTSNSKNNNSDNQLKKDLKEFTYYLKISINQLNGLLEYQFYLYKTEIKDSLPDIIINDSFPQKTSVFIDPTSNNPEEKLEFALKQIFTKANRPPYAKIFINEKNIKDTAYIPVNTLVNISGTINDDDSPKDLLKFKWKQDTTDKVIIPLNQGMLQQPLLLKQECKISLSLTVTDGLNDSTKKIVIIAIKKPILYFGNYWSPKKAYVFINSESSLFSNSGINYFTNYFFNFLELNSSSIYIRDTNFQRLFDPQSSTENLFGDAFKRDKVTLPRITFGRSTNSFFIKLNNRPVDGYSDLEETPELSDNIFRWPSFRILIFGKYKDIISDTIRMNIVHKKYSPITLKFRYNSLSPFEKSFSFDSYSDKHSLHDFEFGASLNLYRIEFVSLIAEGYISWTTISSPVSSIILNDSIKFISNFPNWKTDFGFLWDFNEFNHLTVYPLIINFHSINVDNQNLKKIFIGQGISYMLSIGPVGYEFFFEYYYRRSDLLNKNVGMNTLISWAYSIDLCKKNELF